MQVKYTWEQEANGFVTKSKAGNTIIVSDKDRFIVPIFCPLCDIVMRTYDDAESYKEFDCCETCKIKWAESRKDAWHAGWRPSEQQFVEYVELRLLRPPAIRL